MQFQTLTEALESVRSDKRFVGFIEGQDQEITFSYEELYVRALGLLHVLQQKGLKKGDYLILFLNNNVQMVDVFWACQFGGIIPVPLAVGISDQHKQKVFNVAEKLGNPYLYTDRKTLNKLLSSETDANKKSQLSNQTVLADEITDISSPGRKADIQPKDISFIQFSSGSTGSPKGVVLRHRNLIANLEGIYKGANFTDEDISLSWMPLTHDMGLIGFHINPIVSNHTHYIMRTELFVRRPLYWLIVASDKQADVLCSPNFGYKHFLNAYHRRGLDDIDLSHVRLIFNGAEPISVALCKQFNKEMEKFGLPTHCMFPVYGLAEASLAVSFPEIHAPLSVTNAKRSSLTIGNIMQQDLEGQDSISLVGVGTPILHCKVRISDDNGIGLAEKMVGHIHISGANVTEEIIGDDGSLFYENGWLDTGDLGFVSDKELFITGRFKEILFVNGQNFYPYDIEEVLHQLPGLELGKVVVAGVPSKSSELEEVLVFVLSKRAAQEFLPVVAQVKGLVNENFGIEVNQVIPIRKVPKTTSGKIQRSILADEYLSGDYDDVLQEIKNLSTTNTGSEGKSDDDIVNVIRSVCKEALSDKSFGNEDSLLELGASSLALVEIHTGLDELFPDMIEITDLVEYPTIIDLANFIREKQSLVV